MQKAFENNKIAVKGRFFKFDSGKNGKKALYRTGPARAAKILCFHFRRKKRHAGNSFSPAEKTPQRPQLLYLTRIPPAHTRKFLSKQVPFDRNLTGIHSNRVFRCMLSLFSGSWMLFPKTNVHLKKGKDSSPVSLAYTQISMPDETIVRFAGCLPRIRADFTA